MKAAEEAARLSKGLAAETRQMLYDYLQSKGLTPAELEYAGVPKDYFDGMKPAFRNELGQILLLPVKSVPCHEAFIYDNPERIASIERGVKDIEVGRVVKLELSEVEVE